MAVPRLPLVLDLHILVHTLMGMEGLVLVLEDGLQEFRHPWGQEIMVITGSRLHLVPEDHRQGRATGDLP